MKRTPFVHILILVAFILNSLGSLPVAAQEFILPKPGVMVRLSPPENPAVLKGIKVNPNNPFRFDFILDKGDFVETTGQSSLQDESTKLIKYFLAALTIPERDLWVNLSPYEKERIIPQSFGVTEMGRDLLAEDYMLKQITASLIYPEDEVGKKFWKKIYEEAAKKYGTTNIPVNTFNKVWIVPDKAVVYENAKAGTAYVVESKLKVMLEVDYLSTSKNAVGAGLEPNGNPRQKGTPAQDKRATASVARTESNELGSQIVREIVIPELTKEVNEGKNFAQLRQVYSSLILAAWYKKKIKDSILSQVYADKNKVTGISIDNPEEKQKIYQQYLQAFKKGVYNFIKEDFDPVSQERVPRKYFSGGFDLAMTGKTTVNSADVLNVVDVNQLSDMDRRGFLARSVKAGLFTLAAAFGVAGKEAQATLAVPPGTNRMLYANRANKIYLPLKQVLDSQLIAGPLESKMKDRYLPNSSGGMRIQKGKDVVFEYLNNAKKFLDEALDQKLGEVGDQEKLYHVAEAIKLASNYDSSDERLQQFKDTWEGIQKIHFLTPYVEGKPTALLIHGIGVGPFPYFNKTMEELQKTHNVAFMIYDFLRPAEEVASLINRQVKELKDQGRVINDYVPFSYGFAVYALAKLRYSQQRENELATTGRNKEVDMYANTRIAGYSPMVGGTKKFGIFKMVDPTSWIRLNLGLRLTRSVLKPAAKDFINAVNPDGRIQQELDAFIQNGGMTKSKNTRMTVIFAPGENDIHLNYKNKAYQSMLVRGEVKTVAFSSDIKPDDQHAYIAGNEKAVEEIVVALAPRNSANDKAMTVNMEGMNGFEMRMLEERAIVYPPTVRASDPISFGIKGVPVKNLLTMVVTTDPEIRALYAQHKNYYDQMIYSVRNFISRMRSLTSVQKAVVMDLLNNRDRYISIYGSAEAHGTPNQGAQIGGYFLNSHSNAVHEMAHVAEPRIFDLFNLIGRFAEIDISPVFWSFLREMAANRIGLDHDVTALGVLYETKKSYSILWHKLLDIESKNPGLFPKALEEMTPQELVEFLEQELVRRAFAPVIKITEDFIQERLTASEYKKKLRALFDRLDWPTSYTDAFLKQKASNIAQFIKTSDLRALNKTVMHFEEKRILSDDVRLLRDLVVRDKVEDNDKAMTGNAVVSNPTTFDGRLGSVDEVISSLVGRLISKRSAADPIEILDIGIGFPPVTTVELANKVQKDFPQSSVHVTGLDIFQPDALVRTQFGLKEKDLIGPRERLISPAGISERPVDYVLMKGQKVAYASAENFYERQEGVAAYVAMERIVAGLSRTIKGRMSMFVSRFVLPYLSSTMSFKYAGQLPILSKPWKLYSNQDVRFIEGDYQNGSVRTKPADVVRMFNVEGKVDLNKLSIRMREGAYLIIGYSNKKESSSEKMFIYQKEKGQLMPVSLMLSLQQDSGFGFSWVGSNLRSIEWAHANDLEEIIPSKTLNDAIRTAMMSNQANNGYGGRIRSIVKGYNKIALTNLEDTWENIFKIDAYLQWEVKNAKDQKLARLQELRQEVFQLIEEIKQNLNEDIINRLREAGYDARTEKGYVVINNKINSLNSVKIESDSAMNTAKPKLEREGGINLNSDQLNLQIQNAGEGIKFNLDPALLAQLRNAPGFTPVIMNIQPLESLPLFLGIKDAPPVVNSV